MAEYIERETAIKALMNDAPEQVGYSREDAADCIRYMDAADVAQVRHGKWKRSGALLECQRCGEIYSQLGGNDGKSWNYCPNCGAKMMEG